MKKIIWLILSAFVGALIFIGLVWWIGLSNVINVFKTVTLKTLILYLCVSLFIMSMNVYRWKIILAAHSFKFNFFRLFGYRLAGHAVSYLTPSAYVGGEPVKAILLKSDKVPYKEGFSSVILDKALELSVNVLFVIIGAFVFLVFFDIPIIVRIIFGAFTAFTVGLTFFFYYRIITRKGFFSSFFRLFRLNKIKRLKGSEQDVIDMEHLIADFFSKSKRAFVYSLIISLMILAALFFEYNMLLQMVGYKPSLLAVLLVFSVVGFSYLIPVPGALGILEAGQASLFKAINVRPAAGIVLSIWLRARDSIYAVIGLIVLSHKGMMHLKTIVDQKKESK